MCSQDAVIPTRTRTFDAVSDRPPKRKKKGKLWGTIIGYQQETAVSLWLQAMSPDRVALCSNLWGTLGDAYASETVLREVHSGEVCEILKIENGAFWETQRLKTE